MQEKQAIRLSGFTKPECDFFRENCNFTDDELEVFNLRVRGKSIVQVSFALNMSSSTVKRRISAVKDKICKLI